MFVSPPQSTLSARDLPPLLWLWVPLAAVAARLAIHYGFGPNSAPEGWLQGELGLVEHATVLLLLAALGFTVRLLVVHWRKLDRLAITGLSLFALGCIYFAGEELSWGQHLLGWATPENWAAINDQQETNLHNTHYLLDRGPKLIVELGVFIGGVVLPLWRKRRGIALTRQNPLWWALPTRVCLPTALLVTVCNLPEKIERAFGWDTYIRNAQETKEALIALFLLLFIASLWKRLKPVHSRAIPAPAESVPEARAA